MTDTMKINEIVEAKRRGIDCSENQSAELKMFVKEQAMKANLTTEQLSKGEWPNEHTIHFTEIAFFFPNEFSEACEEFDDFKKQSNITPDEKEVRQQARGIFEALKIPPTVWQIDKMQGILERIKRDAFHDGFITGQQTGTQAINAINELLKD